MKLKQRKQKGLGNIFFQTVKKQNEKNKKGKQN